MKVLIEKVEKMIEKRNSYQIYISYLTSFLSFPLEIYLLSDYTKKEKKLDFQKKKKNP